jgi:uncharacterized damage-inducible protein DinB
VKRYLQRLFDHVAWADAQILQALQASGSKPEEAARLLAHVLAAERVWLMRLNGQDRSPTVLWPDFSLEDGERLEQENRRGYRLLLEQAEERDLFRPVSYRNSKGEHFETPIIDILTHVALHGSYHRGQISRLLRNAGYEPVNTDYIHFVRTRTKG